MMFRRGVGLVLAASLTLPVLLSVATPAQAIGDCVDYWGARGSGTVSEPYPVASQNDLDEIRFCLDKVFRQTTDIALSGAWTPLGGVGSPFTGSYDGRGYSISGLSISQPTSNYLGLFGSIASATLRSIRLSGSVTGKSYVGGLVGLAAINSTITDCHSSVAVTTGSANESDDSIGGLVGIMIDGSITSSSSTGAVTWAGTSLSSGVGGLVGSISEGTVTESWSTSAVAGRTRVGGLVGELSVSVVQRSYAAGPVSGKGDVGGLVGFLYRANPVADMIIDSYARGSVTTTGPSPYMGGSLVGRSELTWEAVANSYGTGSVTGGGDKGGIIGGTPASWSASFWDTDTTGISSAQSAGSVPGVLGKSTAQMTDIATYRSAGWSISNIVASGATWGICASINDGYPFLHALTRNNPCAIAGPGAPPPPWLQAYSRPRDGTCLPGWNPSWAEWPNSGTGGFTCQRTLVYNQSTGQWDSRSGRSLKERNLFG